jgi:glycine C-acetyltransferase
MPLDRLTTAVERHVADLEDKGTAKGAESVVVGVVPAADGRGPRFLLEHEGEKHFLRMNSNSYLGLSMHPALVRAEESGTREYGVGPGATRFISGTYQVYTQLERRLAAFHGREAAQIFSAAYAAIVGIIAPLTTGSTIIISDELNHNSIINAIRLSRPLDKAVYKHNDMASLEAALQGARGRAQRVLIITDGIFSMRGDHAPLAEVVALAQTYDSQFEENCAVIVDDSHGVGSFGLTGRGTEEYTGAQADILIGTLGKAFGVNGGYVAANAPLVRFFRETAPTYIYSNPITAGEAHAAIAALDIVESDEGRALLDRLRALTRRFEQGLVQRGFEVIPGEHPVVPLVVRDTARTRTLVAHLRENGILATGLAYPVVPRGDEEIRFQINADHTEGDIDYVLGVLEGSTDQ